MVGNLWLQLKNTCVCHVQFVFRAASPSAPSSLWCTSLHECASAQAVVLHIVCFITLTIQCITWLSPSHNMMWWWCPENRRVLLRWILWQLTWILRFHSQYKVVCCSRLLPCVLAESQKLTKLPTLGCPNWSGWCSHAAAAVVWLSCCCPHDNVQCLILNATFIFFSCSISAIIAENPTQSSIANPTILSSKNTVIGAMFLTLRIKKLCFVIWPIVVDCPAWIHIVNLMLLGISTIEPLGLWCTCVLWVETVSSGWNLYNPHFSN